MSGAPVTLDKPPGPSHVDSVPRVPESVVFELHPGLVASRLAVAFDNHAVQSGETRIRFLSPTVLVIHSFMEETKVRQEYKE